MTPYNTTQGLRPSEDLILQADWMLAESDFESVDDLHHSNPDLFDRRFAPGHDDNPWDGLGD